MKKLAGLLVFLSWSSCLAGVVYPFPTNWPGVLGQVYTVDGAGGVYLSAATATATNVALIPSGNVPIATNGSVWTIGPVTAGTLITNAAAIDTNILYVALNGNDSTAMRGQPNHPWASFHLALAQAGSNDIVQLGNGDFYFDQVNPAPYVTIRGLGWNSTLCGTNEHHVDGPLAYWISLTNGSKLMNLHIKKGFTNSAYIYPVVCGTRAEHTPNYITNVYLENVWIEGESDTFSPNGDVFLKAKDCFFSSFWDCYTCKYGSNGVQEFLNCVVYSRVDSNAVPPNFWTTYNQGGDLSCYDPAAQVVLKIIGGSVICSNAVGQSCPVVNVSGAPNNFKLVGVDLVNSPYSGNTNNVPGGTAYYLAQGGTVSGHPYPEDRLFDIAFEGDTTNVFTPGAFVGVNTDGSRFWSKNGGSLTNVQNLQYPGHSLYSTNNVRFNLSLPGWVTADNLAATELLASDLILDATAGSVSDSLSQPRISLSTTDTKLYGPGAPTWLDIDASGNVILPSVTPSLRIYGKAFLGSETVTNASTNLFLTANALMASGASKETKSVTIGSGLTFDGTTLAATGTGSQTPWASDIAGAGFNLSGAGSIGGSNIVSGNQGIFTNSITVNGAGPNILGANTFVTNQAAASNPNVALGIDGILIAWSNIITGGKFIGNAHGATNALLSSLVSPTNAMLNGVTIDYNDSESTTNIAGAVAFTAISNFNPTNYNTAIRHLYNRSGADRIITFGAGWHIPGGTIVCTNNGAVDVLITAQISHFTNAAVIIYSP